MVILRFSMNICPNLEKNTHDQGLNSQHSGKGNSLTTGPIDNVAISVTYSKSFSARHLSDLFQYLWISLLHEINSDSVSSPFRDSPHSILPFLIRKKNAPY